MSTFATVLTLCTFASCNTYVVDTAGTQKDCTTNLGASYVDFAMVWNDDRKLTAYLKSLNITEDVKFIVNYDHTCELIEEGDIP